MILVIDDNKYRREEIRKNLYMDDIPAICCERSMAKGYTKPLITIIVDPKQSEYKGGQSNENTSYYYCIKRESLCFKGKRTFICDDCIIHADKIKEILKRDFDINLEQDNIGPVCLYKDTNEIYIGGAGLNLNRNQYMIASFLIYNRTRKFSLEEIYEYLHLSRKLALRTFEGYISIINTKSKHENRGQLINSYMHYYELDLNIIKAIEKVKKLQTYILK